MDFLDTNIILEITLPERPAITKVEKVLEELSGPTAISTLSIHIIMHFGRKSKIPDSLLHKVIKANKIYSLETQDYEWAAENEQKHDFEDALQMSIALRHKCDNFITLDKSLSKAYKNTKINIILP